MRVLAIDTATRCIGCAVWADGAPLASFMLVAGQRHAEVLMPAVDAMFSRAGLTVGDIDAVAVDVGPGLFTGLRVGLATAAAISAARGLPAVGVTSLDALAHPHRRRAGLVAAVIDARRSEVYWSIYRSDGRALVQQGEPAVSAPGDAAARVAAAQSTAGEGPALVVGDGAWRYQDVFAAAGTEVAGPADLWPSPLVIAELGAARLTGRQGAPPGPPVPVYLRQADVRIGWEEVGGRVGPAPPARAG